MTRYEAEKTIENLGFSLEEVEVNLTKEPLEMKKSFLKKMNVVHENKDSFFVKAIQKGSEYIGYYFGVASKKYYDVLEVNISDKISKDELNSFMGNIGMPIKKGPRKGLVPIQYMA